MSWPFATTAMGVDRSRSSELAEPWPELVLTSGRRTEPIARWIQARAPHRVRRVHIGRPWENPANWDLVVTTPQYRLPRLPNIVHNELPLHRVSRARLRAAARPWAQYFSDLPRPRIAVLVGGSSGPYVFDRAAALVLAHELDALAGKQNGSLLLTTSARTNGDAADALFDTIRSPLYGYRWRAGDTENPYLAFLGSADQIVVTGDSMSMIAEACGTGRPVYLYDFGRGRWAMRDRVAEAALAVPLRERLRRNRLKAWIYRTNMRWGLRRLTRDIRVIHRALVEAGRAAWLGEGPAPTPSTPLADVERAVAHVNALFGLEPPRASAAPLGRARDTASRPDSANLQARVEG